jgi:hypothetical protein
MISAHVGHHLIEFSIVDRSEFHNKDPYEQIQPWLMTMMQEVFLDVSPTIMKVSKQVYYYD